MKDLDDKTESELIEQIIENDVISYLNKVKEGNWLIAVVKQDDYDNTACDYKQRHYDGATLKEVLIKVLL
jgi:hypothetical protein